MAMPLERFYPLPDSLPIPPGLGKVDLDAIAKCRPYKIPKAIPKAIRDSWDIVGGLSTPGKLSCYSYSTPAKVCPIGSYLAKVNGTVCSGCYADNRGNYVRFNVRKALWRRYLSTNNPLWVDAIAECIARYPSKGYFRFHDSGDILGLWYLESIARVAEKLPAIKFWLPTREYQTLRDWHSEIGSLPSNLIIRASALRVDSSPPKVLGLPTSTVHKDSPPTGSQCPSYLQGGKCLSCVRCWDRRSKNIAYKYQG